MSATVTAWTDVQLKNLQKVCKAFLGAIPPSQELERVLGHPMEAIIVQAKELGLPVKPSPIGKSPHKTSKGKRLDLGNVFFRSAWEANTARFLNWQKNQGIITRWEYEPVTFEFPVKKGNRFYTPDFRVWFPDGSYRYYELKGWMDKASKTKLARFKRYYKSEPFTLIDEHAYRKLAKNVRELIPYWE